MYGAVLENYTAYLEAIFVYFFHVSTGDRKGNRASLNMFKNFIREFLSFAIW